MGDEVTPGQTRTISADHAENSILLSGDVNINIYAMAPEPLARHIRHRQFGALIEERTRDFVGREYIFRAIDANIGKVGFRSGYILIKGEPGIGKTALIAELARRHGHVHHFNISHQAISSTEAFLTNTCAQLIVRYGLSHTTLPLPEAGRDSGFLSELLAEASAKSAEPVCILVDALDEAEEPRAAGVNSLALPPALPDRVYFVVTTRERNEYRLQTDRQESIYIGDDDLENIADVENFIGGYIERYPEQMLSTIESWGVSPDGFTSIVTDRSEGNFMYLVYVLRDMRDGKLSARNLDRIENLPQGLRSYYERHWKKMEGSHGEAFGSVHQKVVCALAVTREAVSVSQLADWARLPPAQVRRVVREWREFLNEELSERDEAYYRIYHASFRDFLDHETNLGMYDDMIASAMDDKVEADDPRRA